MEFKHINVGPWKDHPRAGRFVRFLLAQPGWVWGVPALLAGLVLVWPLIAAVLTAILLFALVFVILAVGNWLGKAIRSWFAPGDGRKNVQVVGAES